jgi:hypothetical protein
VHCSVGSQIPAEARQTVVDDDKLSAGQLAVDPVHLSAGSQTPVVPRHTVDDDTKLSAGQAALDPVQFSAVSQTPAEPRQTVAEDMKLFAGQAALVPVQFSAVSQTPAEVRHTVDDDTKLSAGQLVFVPSQVSATSHTLAAARQIVLAGATGCWQIMLAPSHRSRVQGSPSSVHAVPLGLGPVSAGHPTLDPVHISAKSQSPEAARQIVVALSKWQLSLQHVWPGVQSQLASVNVVTAVRVEESPVAVSVKLTPMSKTSTMKSVLMMSPFSSATAVSSRSGSIAGSSCRTRTTVSPGSQPLPVMTTVCPGE